MKRLYINFTVACATLVLLTACDGHVEYLEPTVTSQLPNTKTIESSKDQVWSKLISSLSKRFFVVTTIDKQSGLINVSYSGDPELYIDCGQFSSYVKNLRGERTYNFPGASAKQIYESMNNGQLIFYDRRLELDGRVNIIVEETAFGSTKVTANTRYIVTKKLNLSNPQGQSENRSDTISFNSGESATFSGSLPSATCRSNGKLETDVLALAG